MKEDNDFLYYRYKKGGKVFRVLSIDEIDGSDETTNVEKYTLSENGRNIVLNLRMGLVKDQEQGIINILKARFDIPNANLETIIAILEEKDGFVRENIILNYKLQTGAITI